MAVLHRGGLETVKAHLPLRYLPMHSTPDSLQWGVIPCVKLTTVEETNIIHCGLQRSTTAYAFFKENFYGSIHNLKGQYHKIAHRTALHEALAGGLDAQQASQTQPRAQGSENAASRSSLQLYSSSSNSNKQPKKQSSVPRWPASPLSY